MWQLDKPDNLVEMFEDSAKKFSNNQWLGTKVNSKYEWITYKDASKHVDNIRSGLSQLGVTKGDSVGIIANNRVEWATTCYASYGLGAKYIPMYEAELEQVWKYIIADSNIKALFVSKKEILDKIKDWPKEIETLEHIILLEGKGKNSLQDLEKKGSKKFVKSIYPNADDIAGLIYTSGTTGDPKGVLLSHGNITSNVHAVCKTFSTFDEKVVTLSFLPWAHSYGQTAELHTIVRWGGSTGFAESPKTIIDDIKILKPMMLVSVPRIFNKIYDGLNNKMNEKGGIAKFMFNMGLKSAEKKRELQKEGKPCFITNLKYLLADKIVFKKIRENFGGNLKLSMSSSAALSPNISDFFFSIGLPVYEAWGMTELSPAGTTNTPQEHKVGSAGKAIDKVKLVIDKTNFPKDSKEGELIVYGPNVMKGYHNKPDATKETMTEDGGLRTGDSAYIDEDGFLFITGRLKEQFKLENGKFVSPATIEEEIKLISFVEHAMVYGLNKAYTVCLVYPDFEVLTKYAKNNNLPTDPGKLVENDEIKKLIESQILKVLKGKFGNYEIPKKFKLVKEGFTPENGMLTQTLKLKRRKVYDKYKQDIENLYKK